MRRTSALEPLSRDHHQALYIAQTLRRANTGTAPQARDAFLAFWRAEGRHHFRYEEEILLPAYAGHGDAHHPLVVRVLVEHVLIRHRAHRFEEAREGSLDELQQLGVQLAAHVRLEERELFPLIEEALPPAELERVAAALAEAEARG
ncbi:MAG: hemerythrin domain-containing protein [Thermoleophilaceae bacterium]